MVELLGPQHACKRLALHFGGILVARLPGAARVEFISFILSRTENSFKTFAESAFTCNRDGRSRMMLYDRKVIRDPEANRCTLLWLDVQLVKRRGLGACL